MRISDGDGMRLVLCTSDGPTEIWLGPDGEPIDEPDSNQTTPHCVQVHVADVGTAFSPVSLRDVEFSHTVLTRTRDQIAASTPQVTQSGPRAPPAFV